jgi:hypothetical protein
MANRIAGRPWVLDTATPGVPVWTGWAKIANFVFTGYAAAGNTCVINDQNGNLIWQAVGAADLRDQVSFNIKWVQGLIPQVIAGGGKVLVYVD